MGYCRRCGSDEGFAFKCHRCGRMFCHEHRLPENHSCPGGGDGPPKSRERRRQRRKLDRARRTGQTSKRHRIEKQTDGTVRDGTSQSANRESEERTAREKVDESYRDSSGRFSWQRPSDKSNSTSVDEGDLLRRHLPLTLYRFFERVGGSVVWTFWFTIGMLILAPKFVFSRRGVYLIGFGILSIAVVSAVLGTGIEPIDDTVNGAVEGVQDAIEEAGEGAINETATPEGSASPPTNSPPNAGGQNPETSGNAASTDSAPSVYSGTLDTGQIESNVHRFVNGERTDRGLSPIAFDDQLAEVARSHSHDMATRGYFSHTSPDGTDFSDRYESHGYDCRVSIGGNRYATGAENIAYTYADTDVRRDDGTIDDHDNNETSIARGLVRGWMNSQGHRENILRDYWQNEGIGVALQEVDDGTVRVYATQNFC